jgi:hypothetical protein
LERKKVTIDILGFCKFEIEEKTQKGQKMKLATNSNNFIGKEKSTF